METILSTVLTCIVTLVGIFVSAKGTRDKVSNDLNTRNAVQENEMNHIKNELAEIKQDVREHNSYGKKFLEMQGDFKVLENRESVSEHRIEDLEKVCNEAKQKA